MAQQGKTRYSPEFREEAVKLVLETSRPVAEVARELDMNPETLRNWLKRRREEHGGEEPPLGVSERARLREVERELREARMENAFLKKAAAYFAQTHR